MKKGIFNFLVLFILLILIPACDYNFNNPVDPEAENYQRYLTVSSADDVSQVEPENGSHHTATVPFFNPFSRCRPVSPTDIEL